MHLCERLSGLVHAWLSCLHVTASAFFVRILLSFSFFFLSARVGLMRVESLTAPANESGEGTQVIKDVNGSEE